jgi:hypothetical protein
MRAFALTLVLTVVALTHRAHADDDLALIARKHCDPAARARVDSKHKPADNDLCRIDWTQEKPLQYPPRYYVVVKNVNICPDLTQLKVSDDDKTAVDRLCGQSATHETSGLSPSSIGIDLVLGLGDLLEAEAKDEALEFLLSRLGTTFCHHSITIDKASKARPELKIDMNVWFAKSCAAMLPNDAVDVDAFNFGALKTAFKEDLNDLPSNIAHVAQGWFAVHWPDGIYYVVALGVVVDIMYDLYQSKKPLEILNELGDRVDNALKGKATCDLTSKSSITKECIVILAFELTRTIANEAAKKPPIAAMIEDALVKFCKDYGAAGSKDDSKCVISGADYEALHQSLLEVYRAARRLLDLDKALSAMSTDSPRNETSKRSAPEWVRALRQLVDAVGASLKRALPGEQDKIGDDIGLLDIAFDAFDSVVNEDPAALRKALLAALQSKMVNKRLNGDTVHAITVIVSLATAKDRGEVKDILKDVTAPVGSYKMKYGAARPVIALNGFVGFFVGEEIRLHSRNSDGTHHDAVTDLAPLKLAAPIGLDVSLVSGGACLKFWESGNCYHLGITATAIDPLALAVSTKDDTVSADWKTLFEPGLYVRLGLFHSPFTILAGANYQWSRRSNEMCGGDRCFDGAFQIGAFLTADVPLLVIH